MFKNGYLTNKDIVGIGNYSNANGEISEGYIINLNEVEFGNFKLKNVRASIVKNLNAPLLLGQSAISKLGKIELDLNENTITIITNNEIKNNLLRYNHFSVNEIKSTACFYKRSN